MDTNKTVLAVKTLLTVPQAAKRLGVPQRRLRALLARPEFAGRTRSVTLHTRHGVRWTAPAIPLDLLADLDCAVNPVGVQGAETKPPAQASPTVPPAAPVVTVEPGTLPAFVYQKLLDEKDARLADLKQENQKLYMENQKLHAALLLAQNNLARQQVLRALPAPDEAPAPEPAQPAPSRNGHRRGVLGRLQRFFSDDG